MLNKESLINIIKKLYDQSKISHDEFNAVDGKIGDGDLGITILHGLEEIHKNIETFTDDMGEIFMFCSKAFVKKSGSSFGTLIAFSLMNISKEMKNKNNLNHEEIKKIFKISLRTIIERGKNKLGDKTIADTLDLIIKKIEDNEDYASQIKLATKEALVNFKGKKILIGRARMFDEKTKDLDDPGMFALNKLAESF